MRFVAESFAWPFKARLSTWLWGCLCVVLLPLLFIPLFGYAVNAIRSSQPPPWRFDGRLLTDGFWIAVWLLLTLAPFAIAFAALARAISGVALVVGFFVLLFLWGCVALIWLPQALASFAGSGQARDLFDVGRSVHAARRDFMTWNIVVAAIVTAWAIAIACVGLLCVGIVPGVFYAILVSAHATSALGGQSPEGSRLPAR
ncbi:MAG TPA: DUF4013 domain-containing protein [Candidatus Dormibacteraeota bacterium]|nr:DUF4013 domain-containing protein [Candidatus Dormibacteraeota bacterium]